MSCVSGGENEAGLACARVGECGGVSGEGWGEGGGVMGATEGVEAAGGRCVVSRHVLPGRESACVYLLILARCHLSSGKILWPRMADETIAASSCRIAEYVGRIHPDFVHA